MTKAEKLSPEQVDKIEKLKEQLPINWVREYLMINETQFKKRYTRYQAYWVLNTCQENHDGWKVIEGIARRHQEKLEKVA